MPTNCLVNQKDKKTKSQKDKERKRLRVKESKGQREEERKRQPRKPLEEYGGCAAAVMLPFWSYKSKLLTPNRQHPPSFTFYIFQIEIYGGIFNEEIISQKEISTNRFLALAIPLPSRFIFFKYIFFK